MGKIKKLIERMPLASSFLTKVLNKTGRTLEFHNSNQYWKDRYKKGGNSGAGSYNRLAEFKADVLNNFVQNENIFFVIEFGCGDGNQLTYFDFRSYVGFDISREAVLACLNNINKQKKATLYNCKLLSEYSGETADLTLSLDVVYHLIEDDTFDTYMRNLFSASSKFVIIYASNKNEVHAKHVKHRKFTDWVEINAADFQLVQCIPNKYPYDKNNPNETSFADFYIFKRK